MYQLQIFTSFLYTPMYIVWGFRREFKILVYDNVHVYPMYL